MPNPPHPTNPSAMVDDPETKSSYMVYRDGTDWAASGNVWVPGTFAIRFDLADAMTSAGFPQRVQRKITKALGQS
jgi:hypothetical protein